MTITIDDLRAKYLETMESVRNADEATAAATCASADFNLLVARYLRARRAPSGYHVDLFGDGSIKPQARCKLHPDPE